MLSRLFCVIDTQNVSAAYLPSIMDHLKNNVGRISTGRAYMDLAAPNQDWVEQSISHGIDPIGVYCHPRKNSVDHYLVSDVYMSRERFDGLVLISNDSDFRKLALDIKPHALTYLYCRKSSPRDLIKSFDSVFFYDHLEGAYDNTRHQNKKRKRE